MQIGCVKKYFVLDLLNDPYKNIFKHIVIINPLVHHNATYLTCPWILTNSEIVIVDPGERFHDWLRLFYKIYQD